MLLGHTTASGSDMLPLLWAGERRRGGGSADPRFPAGSLALGPSYRLKAPRSVSMQEGLCVRMPCSVSCPGEGWKDSDRAHSYWFRKPANDYRDPAVATKHPGHAVLSETQGRFFLLGDPRTKDCSLDIRDVQRRDTGVYFFRVERGPTVRYNYKWHPLSVRVTALTDTPDIHVQGTLASGRPTNFTCAVPWACDRGTPPTFSWTGVALTSLHSKSSHSSVLTLTPRPQDHDTNLTSRVTFPRAGVSTEATIRLNVSCEWGQEPRSWMRSSSRGGGGRVLGGKLGDSSWRQAGAKTRRLLPHPLLLTPHHNAAEFFFLSLPDAPHNLGIRVFWENSTGVRSLGSMEVRWWEAVKTEQNQAPHHSSPLGCYVSPPLSPTLSPGRTLGPLWTPR
uniref:Ig-like domain-containing protein n=1 Tax=Moschus moschiferus TaxID=68415 RepID=A0A8C6DK42_MOSMO